VLRTAKTATTTSKWPHEFPYGRDLQAFIAPRNK
jgi:hypothetical protein